MVADLIPFLRCLEMSCRGSKGTISWTSASSASSWAAILSFSFPLALLVGGFLGGSSAGRLPFFMLFFGDARVDLRVVTATAWSSSLVSELEVELDSDAVGVDAFASVRAIREALFVGEVKESHRLPTDNCCCCECKKLQLPPVGEVSFDFAITHCPIVLHNF